MDIVDNKIFLLNKKTVLMNLFDTEEERDRFIYPEGRASGPHTARQIAGQSLISDPFKHCRPDPLAA